MGNRTRSSTWQSKVSMPTRVARVCGSLVVQLVHYSSIEGVSGQQNNGGASHNNNNNNNNGGNVNKTGGAEFNSPHHADGGRQSSGIPDRS